MEFNVSQQLKAPIGNTRECTVDGQIDILGIGVSSKVEGTVKLVRTNRGILVQGTIQTQVPVECSRCLKMFDCILTVKIEEEYFPVLDVNSGAMIEIPDDPGSLMIDDHHILDLREAIRQNALLAIPMKPLCREDCAGICPTCGKDLNAGECDCAKETIDPRWSKLAELASLKKKNKQKKETE